MPTQGKVGGCQGSGQQEQRRGPALDQPPCLSHRRACTGPAPAQEARGCCHQSSQQAPHPPYEESASRPLISRKGQELKFPRAPVAQADFFPSSSGESQNQRESGQRVLLLHVPSRAPDPISKCYRAGDRGGPLYPTP